MKNGKEKKVKKGKEDKKSKGGDDDEKTGDVSFNEGDGEKSENDVPINLEKEHLLALYKELKDLGINSIGDLEVKISRL